MNGLGEEEKRAYERDGKRERKLKQNKTKQNKTKKTSTPKYI